MPGLQVGVYPGELAAGTEVSSTYEGRHLTVLESELIHPFRASGFVNKGDPVLLCRTAVPATYGEAIGVAFATATAVTDLIAIDTEGIFNLTVYAQDDDGAVAIEIGDTLYIHDGSTGAASANGYGDAEISKISNTVTQRIFGYALGRMVANSSGQIAVKLHWGPVMVGSKGIDHVQGTTALPVEWGVDISNVKQLIFNVGVLTDYMSGIFVRAYAEADVPAGGIQGLIYSRLTVEADSQDMYAIRGRTDLVMSTPSATIANMIVGGMFSVSLDNPGFALTLADRMKALDVSMSQSATSTITTGQICGMYVAMNGILVDNGGRTQGIYIYQGGGGTSFPDYGIYIQMESANTLAAIKIEQLAAAAGFGIDFEDSGGFGFDALMRYDGVNAQGYFLQLTAVAGVEDAAIPFDLVTSVGTPADRRLRVRCVGDAVDRYIHLFPI
ncbi:MAG: hypothetical protein KKD77_21320 [Gammaproteobacteria bacterium]|nr:hypothetical protein [Gammaproteobacteria bacterium]